MNSAIIVQKRWYYCNILRDDGLPYGDYVEQLTFLLLLKLGGEHGWLSFRTTGPIGAPSLP